MRILFATAELAPVVTVGGLGSAASGLVRALRALGHDVDVVLPDYGAFALDGETIAHIEGPDWAGSLTVRTGVHAQVGALTLIGSSAISKPHPYLDADGNGWPDNNERFFGFSYAVAHLAADRKPDILHVNDWHTAAALSMLDPAHLPATVLSVHNLAYQGICAASWIEHLGPRAHTTHRDAVCNPLAAGIALADAIVVVSPTYRKEILEPQNACGLHDLLTSRQTELYGIRNGVETDVWDPTTDPNLLCHFDRADLSGKYVVQEALRRELGLAQPVAKQTPSLTVIVSRLAHQKGIDEIVPLVPYLASLPTQLAILGNGDHHLAAALRAAADANPENIVFIDGFVDSLSHRLIAGGDFLLMPSRFEPCGLTQMQAMRYGTVPVVAGVGGLIDTVIDADQFSASGTGFVALSHHGVSMLDAWHRAQRAWRIPSRRRAIQRRGMHADWSWSTPAERHVAVYEHLMTSPNAQTVSDP